jgi:hypothetical protein
MTSKILLVTNAVAVQLLSLAASLQLTAPQYDSVDQVDGFKIDHSNEEHGVQSLVADRIHKNLFVVSFVGHQAYLDKIHSDGWRSSIDTLILYLEEELKVEIDRQDSIGSWAMIENDGGDSGQSYLLFATDQEDYVDLMLQNTEMQRLLAVRSVDKKFEAMLDEMVAGADDLKADASSVETVAETPTGDASSEDAPKNTEGWGDRLKHFATTRTGKVLIGLSIAAAICGVGSLLFRGDVPTEA